MEVFGAAPDKISEVNLDREHERFHKRLDVAREHRIDHRRILERVHRALPVHFGDCRTVAKDVARELIRFVRFEDGMVRGTLEPYEDPDCGCAVYTTFEGTMGTDTIEGTFTSRPGHGSQYKGTWYVMRKKK